MSQLYLKFNRITFKYESAVEPLFREINLHLSTGWTGVVGANGSGKTTLLKLAAGILEPLQGHIQRPPVAAYCAQRTDHVPDRLAELIAGGDKTGRILKHRLGIEADWPRRWTSLSHGERKRAQVGTALWLEPNLLAIDEPFNHLDTEARDLITLALASYRGLGLLVSHDRDQLDRLCGQCLFVEPPQVTVRPGGLSRGLAVLESEKHFIQKQYGQKKQALKRLHRETARRRELARQSSKRMSGRSFSARDHDAREKRNLARLTGKDAVGGKLQRQIQGRLVKARQDLEQMAIKKEYDLGIWLPGCRSERNFLLHLKSGCLHLGGAKQLRLPELFVRPTDRIAVTGPNGSGKSTLIGHLVDSLNIPDGHITYVPQEIEIHRASRILEQVKALSPEQLGHLMTIISRLGSRPRRLLESSRPSPGETRKLLLALGMTREPHIIVMDEPTNHMDLPSIQCLEEALAECPCALVLVSHDRRFQEKLTRIRWDTVPLSPTEGTYALEIRE